MIARPRIDLVTRFEPLHPGSDFDNRSGKIVPEDEGRTIGQNKLELSVPDLGVQLVHGCGLNPHEDIIVLQFRFRQVGQAQSAFLFVLINDECLHGAFSCCGVSQRLKSAWTHVVDDALVPS